MSVNCHFQTFFVFFINKHGGLSMAKQKITGKAPEPKVEVGLRELRDISAKIGILIEILERIESRLNGGF